MPKKTEIKLKARGKILLYLSLLENYSEKLKPSLITQQGIAEAIYISRSRVTKILKELIIKGFVKQEIGYVEKIHREVKIHSLTAKGYSYLSEIENELRENEILFTSPGGLTKRVKISKIINDLETQLGFKPSILEIFDYISENILNSSDLKDKIMKQRVTRLKGKKTYINNLPDNLKSLNFYGRIKELKLLRDCMENEECKIITIRSFPGMGKTTLGYKLIEEYKSKMNIFWFEIQEWNSLTCILKPFSEFLSKLGKTKLTNYILNTNMIDLNDILDYLVEELKNFNILIAFDDCQKAIPEINMFFEGLKFILQKTENVKTLLLSRETFDFYDIRDVKFKNLVLEIELNGLDEKASIEFLSTRGIDKSICSSLYNVTKGYPLALEVVDEIHETKEPIDITRFISEAIFFLRDVVISKMNENEKKLMDISSVYRKPVSKDAIIFTDELNHDTIDGLVNKSLLKELDRKEFTMHAFLRELFYDRLTLESKQMYHSIAGNFCEKIGGEMNCLEAIYHFNNADEYDKGVKIAINQGFNILKKGYAHELFEAIKGFDEKNIQQKQWINILVLKGEVTFVTAKWDDALRFFNNAINFEKNTENGIISTAYTNKGHIKREQAKWDEALECYQKALLISKKEEDYHVIADTYRGIGKVYWRLGKFKEAIKNLNECMKYADKINDLIEIAKTYNDLGNIYANQNNLEKAIELFDKKDNIYERSRVYNNIGVSYYIKGNYEKALEYWEMCIKTSENLGTTSTKGWAFLNASDVYVKSNRFQKGEEYLKKSEKIMNKLENKIGISQVYLTYGRIYKNSNNYAKAKKYIEMSIEIAKKLHSQINLAERYYELAMIYDIEKNPQQTMFYLKKALKIYTELNEVKLINKIKEIIKKNR